MISDDAFRSSLTRTTAELATLANELRDVAAIEHGDADGVVQFTLLPHADGACPFEIGIRADQCFDLVLDDQLYEDEAVVDLGLFEKLARAVANGSIVRRQHLSALTGQETGVEMIALLGGGETWSRLRQCDEVTCQKDQDGLFCDRHYLPYRLRSG